MKKISTSKGAGAPRARYVMVGGFLGAGKTTAILELAGHLQGEGLRVGLITNDQSIDLVDTARARAAGHSVEEVTGGCFCCKFDSLVEAAQALTRQSAPDVLIAEPVGSCTDLKATVGYPLQQLYGDDYQVAPLSVLVDPKRCAAVLGLERGRRFSEKVTYVYRKQLEEAEVIVVHKADLLGAAEIEELTLALGREFPGAEVLAASSVTGAGLEAWFRRVLESDLGRGGIEVDYDAYAEGEALLGWLNVRGALRAVEEFDGDDLLRELASRLNERFERRRIEVAHLKMTLAPCGSPELAAVSVTRTGEEPRATHRLTSPLALGELLVNLRAEADPELLKREVLEELEALAPEFECLRVEAFRPGRPQPAHRLEAK
jgi:Ni2+-binding GTPase involved in maturation of urease and hydrogenase